MTARFAVAAGSTHGLADAEAFVAGLPAFVAAGLFSGQRPLAVARAPGRLDVMGGIADYSGSLVLELPIREAALVAVERRPDRRVEVASVRDGGTTRFSISLGDLEAGAAAGWDAARGLFVRNAADRWAAYVAGAFVVLMRERGVRFGEGAAILVQSAVPEGKGVASSAAIEVATLQAVAAAFDVVLSARELALLCQVVENRVAGAPCGVMDQMTAACGEAGKLLVLRCQPCEHEGNLEIPNDLALFGIDSDVQHAVGGAAYGRVRAGAFMGYRILAELLGCAVTRAGGEVRVADPHLSGYLANLDAERFHAELERALPDELGGAAFLERYGGTTDAVTRIDHAVTYPVRRPTAHPVEENARVERFRRLLAGPMSDAVVAELGALMFASHASYSACGLGSAETDWLVERVRSAASVPGAALSGAKITGGGSGGTVAVLGRRSGSEDSVQRIAGEYAERTGRRPRVFSGSSRGAASFGVLYLRPAGG